MYCGRAFRFRTCRLHTLKSRALTEKLLMCNIKRVRKLSLLAGWHNFHALKAKVRQEFKVTQEINLGRFIFHLHQSDFIFIYTTFLLLGRYVRKTENRTLSESFLLRWMFRSRRDQWENFQENITFVVQWDWMGEKPVDSKCCANVQISTDCARSWQPHIFGWICHKRIWIKLNT